MRNRKSKLANGLRFVVEGWGMTLLLMMAIILGAIEGVSSPATGQVLGGFVDYTVLTLVGLLFFELKISSLRNSASGLRFLSIAWITNFVIVPAIGFVIASVFLSGQSLFYTGLVIYFMAPCTDWFLGFTRLSKGNTALGAVLLPINMITQLLLYPLYIHLFANGSVPQGATAIGATILQWFFIPFVVAVGGHQMLRLLLPTKLFEKLLQTASLIVPFVVAALVFEIFAANVLVIAEHVSIFSLMLLAIFLFFVATFAVGEAMSRLAGFAYPEHALLTMTTAARNAPMMLGVTAVAMPNQPLIYAAIIIGMLVEFPHLTALRQILLANHGKRLPGAMTAARLSEGNHAANDLPERGRQCIAFTPRSAGIAIAMFMTALRSSKDLLRGFKTDSSGDHV